MSRKICVITSSRADFGLLSPLIKEIELHKDLTLQLITTGSHLSHELGYTCKEVEDSFSIDKKVDISLSSDSALGISKSMGLAQEQLVKAYSELEPDIVLVLGDRYEILSAVIAAMISNIPVAHLDGGETTEGAMDEYIRHSITKMSHLHFTCNEEYRKRVIQLGENPSSVFNTGSTGVDSMKSMKLLSKDEFEESIGFKLNKKNLSVTFHPVTLEGNAEGQFQELLNALDTLENTNIIFTKANADSGGDIINKMIDEYVKSCPEKTIAFESMGYHRYLSSIVHVDALVGNSSSGITEAPFYKTPTVNIGDRQKGRIRVESILDCKAKKDDIIRSVKKIYTKEFQDNLKRVVSPYGNGTASKQIVEVLSSYNLDDILKKSFYDLEPR